MAIFARPASTRPGPTLMGQVLPGLIRNRVGYEFFFKNPKGVQVGSRFYKKIQNLTRNLAQIKPDFLEIKKIPLIYIVII